MKKIMLAVLLAGALLICSCNNQKEVAGQSEKSVQDEALSEEQTQSEPQNVDEKADKTADISEEIGRIIDGAMWVTEYESKESVSLFDLSAVNDSYAGKPSRYAVSDIDEDGIPELVVEFSLTADISVIKKEADGWYAYLNLYDDSKLNDSIHAWLSF